MMTITVDDIIQKYEGRRTGEGRDAKPMGAADFHSDGDDSQVNPSCSLGSEQKPVSVEREKQIEFCNLLWEGIQERVAKAIGGNAAVDSAEDMELRKAIFEQLQNPQVNFRDFSRLVYRWRDLHLKGMLPPKATVELPLWRTKSIREGGEEDEMNRDGPVRMQEVKRNGTD